jgi:hypothetical protein
MRTGIALCASLLAALLTSSVQADVVNLLTNGTFQKSASAKLNKSGIVPITTRTNKTALPGWTISSGAVDLVSSRLWQSPTGANYSVDLIGSPGIGSISQTVVTDSDTMYQLSFDLTVNPQASPRKETGTTKILRVEAIAANGTVLVSRDYSMTNGTRTLKNMQWLTDLDVNGEGGIFQFRGTDGNVTIKFSALSPTPLPKKSKATTVYCGPVIGDVSLIEVGGAPEPASLGILGVGASALLLKRRRGR